MNAELICVISKFHEVDIYYWGYGPGVNHAEELCITKLGFCQMGDIREYLLEP